MPVIVRESRTGKSTAHLQRAYLMHVDLAAVRDHRVVSRLAAMEPPAAGARREAIRSARLPARDAQGRRRVAGLVVQVWGRSAWRRRADKAMTGCCAPREVTRLRRPRAGLRSSTDQATSSPRGSTCLASSRTESRVIVTRFLPNTASSSRRRALLVLHHVHDQHARPLEHARDRAAAVQDDYDRTSRWEDPARNSLCASAYERVGLATFASQSGIFRRTTARVTTGYTCPTCSQR